MFKKILIANRGEVALRIIRAARELGISTVAVYSEADGESLHVRYADEHICIGKASSLESYLDISRVLAAAEITGADAIHPGWGFLAENAHFAEVCEASGITFIGPTSKNIAQLGDKTSAKRIMSSAEVPLVPGSTGDLTDADEAITVAEQIGYPIILKPTAGGGGKGMKIVWSSENMKAAYTNSTQEAKNAFNDSRLYMEKYIEAPRHVEIQVVADNYGNVVHLGERDCTVQRRHQKLIEETPSPALDKALRHKMGAAAVRGAREAGYQNLGTFEFLLDKHKKFYFMEVNTRLQVEHTVTEEATGIDLVKKQIRLAAGEKLKLAGHEIEPRGHTIEVRINAEDFKNNFMPCPGKITAHNIPGGPHIRVDTIAYEKYKIPPYYDSLIGKLIVHGQTREDAVQIMLRALEEYIIEGVKTTIDFYKEIFNNETFRSGVYTTHFIEHLEKEGKINV